MIEDTTASSAAEERQLRGWVSPQALLGVLALLALGWLYFVLLTGDLGARPVWQGRVQSASLGHAPQPLFGQS